MFFDIRMAKSLYDSIDFNSATVIKSCTDYSFLVGGLAGDLRILDLRKTDRFVWINNGVHKSAIYDICRMRGKMITSDKSGQIVGWRQY